MLIDSRCISSLLSKENAKNSLWFCKDKHVKKRQLHFDVAKVAVLHGKIILKIQLIENKEVTLLV